MTAKEWLDEYIKHNIIYVHADHNERIHEKVKEHLEDYEVVRIRHMYHRNIRFVEVREKWKHL